MRVSVMNERVDPVSATGGRTVHSPGLKRLKPLEPSGSNPASEISHGGLLMVSIPAKEKMLDTSTCQSVMKPDASVENTKDEKPRGDSAWVIVCTPSDNLKTIGVTWVKFSFAPSGAANVTIAVTKSLVV